MTQHRIEILLDGKKVLDFYLLQFMSMQQLNAVLDAITSILERYQIGKLFLGLLYSLIEDTDPKRVERLRDRLIPILDAHCQDFTAAEAAFALQMLVDGYLTMTFDFEQTPHTKSMKRKTERTKP